MGPHFYRNLRIVALIHVAVVIVLCFTAFRRCVVRREPERTVPVEFLVEVPPAPEAEAAPVAEPPPTPPPERAPAPRERKKIEISRKRVTRTTGRSTPAKPLSEEEIRKLLAQGARPADRTVVPPDEASRSLALIRQAFEAAWHPPGAEGIDVSEVSVRIRFTADGTVVQRDLVAPSGNEVLDASVRQALAAIRQVKGLSTAFLEDRGHVVTIAFEVK
jgi:outer membrane biosynthesis protein TonB